MTNLQFLTDKQLQFQHQTVLELTALLENGTRIGVSTIRYQFLAGETEFLRKEIEAEYFRRHPEEPLRWKRNFLASGQHLIDQRAKKRKGDIPALAGSPEIDALFDELKTVIGEFAKTLPKTDAKNKT